MRKILLPFIFISFLLSNKTTIDLITTNDMHGSISEQNAYFMNPKFPPTIIGAAGFYEYVKKNTNSNKVVNCETAVSVAILLKKYLKQINN